MAETTPKKKATPKKKTAPKKKSAPRKTATKTQEPENKQLLTNKYKVTQRVHANIAGRQIRGEVDDLLILNEFEAQVLHNYVEKV